MDEETLDSVIGVSCVITDGIYDCDIDGKSGMTLDTRQYRRVTFRNAKSSRHGFGSSGQKLPTVEAVFEKGVCKISPLQLECWGN